MSLKKRKEHKKVKKELKKFCDFEDD